MAITDLSVQAEVEQQLRTTLDAIPALLWSAHPNGDRDYLNQGWLAYTGLSMEAARGLGWMQAVHPDDLAVTRQIWQEAIQNQADFEMEHRLRRFDGEYRWFLVRARRELDSAGQAVRWHGVNLDITERKEVEKRLAYQAYLLDNISESIVASDADYRLTAWNAAAEAMYGWKAGEVLGRVGLEVVQTQFKDTDKEQMLRQIAEQGYYQGEATQVRKDGARFDVEVSSYVLRDERGRITGYVSINRDITEIKQARGELKRFFDLVPDMVAIASTDGYFKQVNQAWEITLGYPADELLARPFAEFIHPDDREATFKEVERQVNGQAVFSFINRYLAKDGEYHWLEWHGTPSPDGMTVYAAARDITDRKRLEASLIANEQRFHGTLDGMQEGVLLIGYDWRYLYINKSAEIQGRRPKEELLGRTVQECWPGFEDSDIFRLEQKVMQERIPELVEGPFTFPDGEEHWFEWHIQPAEAGLLIVTVDNTDRKREERLLRESEERFNRAFRASPIGINIFRQSDGCSLDVNDAYLEMTGYSRAEVVGHTSAELNLFVFPSERLEWMQALQLDGVARNVESAIRTKTGEICHVLASLVGFEMNGEKVALALSVDITARKQAEGLLLSANAILEERVRQRTNDLQAANRALEKALRAKDEFMAAMSHELRTPLTGILGMAEVLEYSIYGSLNARQLSAVQMISMSGKRLLELINDVLTFAQLQSGNFDLQIGRYSLADICQSSLEAVAGQAAAKGQRLGFEIMPDTILLDVDLVCIQRMLSNLLDNAIKFTPKEGGIRLSVTGLPAEQRVQISVTDTGIGIPAEDFPRLFLPFLQLDARLAREYEGTGLGLALVKALAELLGGSVAVESVVGQGSCFTVSLPWRPENPAAFNKSVSGKAPGCFIV